MDKYWEVTSVEDKQSESLNYLINKYKELSMKLFQIVFKMRHQ